MADFVDINYIHNLLKVSNSISAMELPPHVLIILLLVFLFNREGVTMDGQCAIDTARGYYLHILHRYMELVRNESSKINASLQSALKTIKDFGEEMRAKSVEELFYV